MTRRIALLCFLLLILGPAARGDEDKSHDKPKVVTLGALSTGEPRTDVEGRVGPPILSDPQNRIYQYVGGITVIYDASDRAINIHGSDIEVDGTALGSTDRKEIEKLLGPGKFTQAAAGLATLTFGKYGLTVYMHDDAITGYLLEPRH